MASVKKPKVKGKNRIFVGEAFGMKTSPKIVKTWHPIIRKAFAPQHKSRSPYTGE